MQLLELKRPSASRLQHQSLGLSQKMRAFWQKLTVGKVDKIQPLITSRVFQSLKPQLARSICMSPEDGSAHVRSGEDCVCIPMEHDPLGNSDLQRLALESSTRAGKGLTMLSCVSLRAESFASTASSVYAISTTSLGLLWQLKGVTTVVV